MVGRDIPHVPDDSEIPEEPHVPEKPDIPDTSKVRRRFIVEFQDFDNLTKQHVEVLLSTFEIKSVSYNYVQKLRQSTPFIEQLLPWDLIWDTLSNITDLKSVRFGALNPSLTRRDLEALHDRARDLSKLYAPIRFVVFEFDVPDSIDENDLIETIDSLDADSINEARPPERPWAKATKLEKLPTKSPAKPTQQQITDAQQEFMLPAAQGIGAYDVWDEPGGKGQGIKYVDIEYGWELYHPDLPTIVDRYEGTYSYNVRSTDGKDHGTGMLGIISAQHNSIGSFGIAPGAVPHVLSQLRGPNLVNLPGAIEIACARILRPGDVLLIEAQTTRDNGDFMPVELEREVFAAIEFGITLGVTIIEPAGNSGVNLDEDPDFPLDGADSGAILVAACQDDSGAFVRWSGDVGNTNYGGWVDCFAWGDVLGTLTSDLTQIYKQGQGGTSAASAIIAGAAILVQSLYQAKFNDGSVIWPKEMRDYLTSASGTSSNADQNIGIMPNLADIYANLNTAATVPVTTPLSNIPDSLLDAVSGLGVSAGAGQASIPRLVTFASYALMTLAIVPAAPAGRAGSRIRALLSRWRRRKLAQS